MARLQVLWLLAFLVGCHSNELLNRPQRQQLEPLRMGDVTCFSESVTQDLRLNVKKGTDYWIILGNTNDVAATIAIEGGKPNSLQLKPGWQKCLVTAESQQLVFKGNAGCKLSSVVPLRVKTRPNVMLISVDTLRADHFNQEHMPNTYRLFKERGAIWQNAYTTSPWTLPAHASLLTSLYPARHGVRLSNDALSSELVTVATAMKSLGYYTLSMNEGNYLSASYQLNHGFDWYRENAPDLSSSDPQSASVLQANLSWLSLELDQLSEVPVFAFFHTYEVHCPFLPRFGLSDEHGYGHTDWLLANDGRMLDAEESTHLKALYANEVKYLDETIAPWISGLLDDGWLVCLVSDHGEEFGEHGGLLHADNLFEEAVRVPIAMAGPGVDLGVYSVRTNLLDVAPTLVELSGGQVPASWQGRVLPAPELPTNFAESYFFGPHINAKDARIYATWRGNYKLIQSQQENEFEVSLFDLATDPQEQDNLQETESQRRDHLYNLLEIYLEQISSDVDQVGDLSEEQLELMRSLGYLQ